eukprot:1145823-Pelagomonas_calceolata.AAC.9
MVRQRFSVRRNQAKTKTTEAVKTPHQSRKGVTLVQRQYDHPTTVSVMGAEYWCRLLNKEKGTGQSVDSVSLTLGKRSLWSDAYWSKHPICATCSHRSQCKEAVPTMCSACNIEILCSLFACRSVGCICAEMATGRPLFPGLRQQTWTKLKHVDRNTSTAHCTLALKAASLPLPL